MSIGLIGTKIGMTREFLETGQSVPVTVIKVEKGRVLDIISEDKRGYKAVKLGFFKLKNSKFLDSAPEEVIEREKRICSQAEIAKENIENILNQLN